MVKILPSFIPKWSPKWFLKKWWYQRRTMLMICSVKTWLSFFKLTLMDPLIFHSMQSPFSHLKILEDFLYASIGHWSNIFHLGTNFPKIQKQWSLSLRNYGNVQGKYQLFLFQSSCQCFISVLQNIDFLNQLRSCYSSFTFKLNLLHMIIRYFLGISPSSLSCVFVVRKTLLLQNCLGNFYSWHPWLFLIIL